ncbi:MAG: hypothetical protein J6S10_04910 [Clostridia bacterium]|nr:hypothetical protein [Clostridia bacterium]
MDIWVKIIGSALLCASGGFSALSLCRYHRRKLDTVDGFISLIYYIKGQVDCYARPIGDILFSLPPEILRDCNCPAGATSLEELVNKSRIYLDRESLRLVTSFSSEFGSIFREEQTRRCEHYASQLSLRRDDIAARLSAEMRSGSAICICTSLCLAILLW